MIVIYDTTVAFVSEQSTKLSVGLEVVSSRILTVEYCLPKTELLKTGVVSSLEVVFSLTTINLNCVFEIF